MVTRDVVRTCVGCRSRATVRELLRVVAGEDAREPGTPAVVPDPRRIAPGRGAHLHPTPECLALAERRRAFPRALFPKERGSHGLSTRLLGEYLEQITSSETQPTHQENWSTSS